MFILQKKSNRLSTGMVFDEGSIDLNTRLVHLGISLDAQFPPRLAVGFLMIEHELSLFRLRRISFSRLKLSINESKSLRERQTVQR